ncbi:dethiobiotin synthase [Aliikangiella sp. G2MR2-5]|uniref:dethiobiotin synthase n=1 Tax=Aliikangiella sp. G2MR2-5 TaxID=2788943 RepID=UPI0018A8D45D|nr:dethiobiotin synthase [Aliikangiella sp. G2MR2-5]
MTKRLFITGTDTEVGKTFFTCALIHALKREGHSVMAFKPVAAGCELVNGEMKNDDALAIISALGGSPDYSSINPIALQTPIAPHIAAQKEGIELSVQHLTQQTKLEQADQEFVLVEGAGGWLVPLNADETLADFARVINAEVVLVVGMKLGCINHALLTQQSICGMGLKLAGWVANYIDPDMLAQQSNLESLKQSLNCPLIAEIPYLSGVGAEDMTKLRAKAADYVKIASLV